MKITKSQLRQMIREELKPLMPTPPEKSAEIIIDAFYNSYKEKGYLAGEVSMKMLMDKIRTYQGKISQELLQTVAQKRVDKHKSKFK